MDISKITKLREDLGLTQQQAAERAGFTLQRWNDIERGREPNPKLNTIEAVAKALEVKAAELLK